MHTQQNAVLPAPTSLLHCNLALFFHVLQCSNTVHIRTAKCIPLQPDNTRSIASSTWIVGTCKRAACAQAVPSPPAISAYPRFRPSFILGAEHVQALCDTARVSRPVDEQLVFPNLGPQHWLCSMKRQHSIASVRSACARSHANEPAETREAALSSKSRVPDSGEDPTACPPAESWVLLWVLNRVDLTGRVLEAFPLSSLCPGTGLQSCTIIE